MCSNLAKGVELAHKAQLAALANEKRLTEFKSLDPSIISDSYGHRFSCLAAFLWSRLTTELTCGIRVAATLGFYSS